MKIRISQGFQTKNLKDEASSVQEAFKKFVKKCIEQQGPNFKHLVDTIERLLSEPQ